ncbi:helix-turn-helix domain protein [Kribbella flavida DSM 17836]|uniref:Helix-turn-helix domain protein n=1 Tax=Kribbella flavida (strain DSM 17836 / JCM 10339 / NBRC 14399) TaxID=479435 RepID=D2PY83_KRIFD|nr:helix-turn-helix transcriptional regulator [Kribbella flavida]ADB35451.1 helix-turn-helix domain protein [Kribbella flavida DSM 17836]
MPQTRGIPRPVSRALADIGSHLATWRRLQQLTAGQVGDRAGVSRATVQRLEAGDGASLENTLRIARALGVMDLLVAAVDPYSTDVGRLRADQELPQRVRQPGRKRRDGDAES